VYNFCISATIGNLEATKLQNESTIQDLEGEINKLKDKLAWLEKERMNLERQKSSLTQNQMSQLKSLEKVCHLEVCLVRFKDEYHNLI
jgi:FtsZ-binding cell division protein ZapB